MLWFTSDLHLNHANIIRYSHRPYDSTEEMGVSLVRAINERVGTNDTLWVLGDVCMGQGKDRRCASFLSQLVCQDVRLVRGNHDPKDDALLLSAGFAEVRDLCQVSVGNKRKAVLCHYPLLSWDRRASGALMLHGHIHSQGMDYNWGNRREGTLRYDVGVDANGYRPVSADSILRFFDGVEPSNPFL